MMLRRDSLVSGWDRRAFGKSIAQRSRRSQRGNLRLDGARLFGERAGFWARKTRIRKEHRTEVTEVTEGEFEVGGARLFGGRAGFWARKTALGRAPHGGRGGSAKDLPQPR
jgi:hypothetical protein